MKSKIENRFFYFKFRVHAPTFKKVDRGVTRAANNAHGASDGAGSYVKLLIDQAVKRTMDSAQVAARNKANSGTYSFDNNYRLGLIEDIDKVMATAREAKTELEETWERLLLNEETYNEIIQRHKLTLGSMYNEREMLSFENLKHKFWIELDVRPIQNVDQFQALGIANDEIERIAEETETRMNRAFSSAVDSLKKDVKKALVGDGKSNTGLLNIINKIDGKVKTKVHESILVNLDEIASKIDAVQGFGDSSLQGVVKEIRAKISNVSTAQLKHNDKTRAEIKKSALSMVEALNTVTMQDEAQSMVDNLDGLSI